MNSFTLLFKRSFIFIFVVISFLSQGQVLKHLSGITGSWAGKLKIQSVELTVVFNISLQGNDSLLVTLDSPDQGAKGIPTSNVLVTEDSITIEANKIGARYKGAFSPDFSELTGTFRQGGFSFPLTLKHSVEKFELNRPQEPKPPFPYNVQDISFMNEHDKITLSGTLTTPKEGAPFPAVVLITGSGPQNRDEEILGHKPFLLLADQLTRKGIAVLRYDDRGFGKSGGIFAEATTIDFANDVSAAVDFLKTVSSVDSSKIGLIGHSEGGLIAPIVASTRKDIAFIVLMAGPGVSGEKILKMQTELIAKASGSTEEEIAETTAFNEKAFSIVKKNKDNERAAKKLRQLMEKHQSQKKDQQADPALARQQTEAEIKNLVSPWFRLFLVLEPVDYLSKVHCPLLALNGELDMQVPPKENLETIEKAMIFGGNANYTIELVPGVNHLFQTAKTGSPDEYAKIEETIAPAVLDMMTGWVVKNVKKQ